MSTFTIEVESPNQLEALVQFLQQNGLKYAQKEKIIQENLINERRKRLEMKILPKKENIDRATAEKIILQGVSDDFDTDAMIEYLKSGREDRKMPILP
ncbi:MAG: hypothetical protein RLZZ292_469 [Bacteroidota bacterium]|jgi:hypothetical protein